MQTQSGRVDRKEVGIRNRFKVGAFAEGVRAKEPVQSSIFRGKSLGIRFEVLVGRKDLKSG